jgi:hypothetical protein
MPYGMPPGSAFGKSDIRSSGSERRKRKYVTYLFSDLAVENILIRRILSFLSQISWFPAF